MHGVRRPASPHPERVGPARIPKESARPEVPPRTFDWCDTYFRCERCAKVFWRGTHWRKIEARLNTL